jgi:hypothetical protein
MPGIRDRHRKDGSLYWTVYWREDARGGKQ